MTTKCTRNASCKCDECLAAMGMFTAKDLQSIASSKTFEDEPLPTMASTTSNESQPLSQGPTTESIKSMTETSASSVQQTEKPLSGESSNTIDVAVDRPLATENMLPPAAVPQQAPNNVAEGDSPPDYERMPLLDRIQSKDWKARRHAFEEIHNKLASNAETGMAFISESTGNNHKNVMLDAISNEKNIGALDAAMDAAAIYVVSDQVLPCKGASDDDIEYAKSFTTQLIPAFDKRVTTRQRAIQVCSCIFSAGGAISCAVVEVLVEGVKGKSPKQVTGCLEALEKLCNAYGVAAMPMKSNLEALSLGFVSKHVLARKETIRGLASELVRWLGEAGKYLIVNQASNDTQQKEIRAALDKVSLDPPPTPEECFRGQSKTDAQASSSDKVAAPKVDMFDLLQPNDVVPKLDGIKFSTRVQAAKWLERKSVLSEVQTLCGSPPKLNPKADYNELEHAIQLILKMDSNQAVVVQAISLTQTLTEGLRESFAPNARHLFPLIIPRFKDKKSVLSASVDKCLDSFATWCIQLCEERALGVVQEQLVASNPVHHRLAVFQWLTRSFSNGNVWKLLPSGSSIEPYLSVLAAGLGDPDSKIRSHVASSFASFLKPTSDIPSEHKKALEICVEALQSGNPRAYSNIQNSVQKLSSNTSSKVPATKKPPTPKESAPTARVGPKRAVGTVKDNVKPKPARKPAPASVKSSETTSKPAPANSATIPAPLAMDEDSAMQVVIEHLKIENLTEKIEVFKKSVKWQEKKLFFEELGDSLTTETLGDANANDALISCLSHWSKNFKESNFNIINAVWNVATKVSKTANDPFISKSACITLFEGSFPRISDRKQSAVITQLWDSMTEVYGPGFTMQIVTSLVAKQKIPKVCEGYLDYVTSLVTTFGTAGVDLPSFLSTLASTSLLGSSNIAVKNSAGKLVTVLYEIFGEPVRATLGTAITPGLAKQLDKITPASKKIEPKKAVRAAPVASLDSQTSDDGFPRKDVSSLFTPKLVEEMGDTASKNAWKIRAGAIDQVKTILEESGKRIQMSSKCKAVAQALRQRFGDSNRNLAAKALVVLGLLATSVGVEGAILLGKLYVGYVIGCLGDSKKAVTTAAYGALENWVIHDGKVVPSVVATILGVLPEHLVNTKLDRAELLKWVCSQVSCLNTTHSEVLLGCTKGLLNCFKSRDAAVRKQTSQLVGLIAEIVGVSRYQETLMEDMRDLKPAVARSVLPLVETALANGKQSQQVDESNTAKESMVEPSPPTLLVSKNSTVPSAGARVGSKELAEPVKPSSNKQKSGASRSPKKVTSSKPLVSEEPPTFLNSEQRVKERRLELSKRNRWPVLFDVKDVFRHQDLEQQLQQELEKVMNSTLLRMMFVSADKGRGTRGAGLVPAFNALQECLGSQPQDVLMACDLLLKWSTLHLMSTNTTMTSSLLGFLQLLFQVMKDEHYKLSEVEVASFLPHLVRKLGDKQQRFRDTVRGIMRLLYKCFAASECLLYVADGASANERNVNTRSECLNEIGNLIRDMGYHQVFGKRMKLGVPSVPLLLASAVRASQKEVRSEALRAIQAVWEQVDCDAARVLELFTSSKAPLGDKELTLVQNFLAKAEKKAPPSSRAVPERAATVTESTNVTTIGVDKVNPAVVVTPPSSPPREVNTTTAAVRVPTTPPGVPPVPFTVETTSQPTGVPNTPETPKIYRELLNKEKVFENGPEARSLVFEPDNNEIPTSNRARRGSTTVERQASAAARKVGLNLLDTNDTAAPREESKRPMVEFHRRVKDMMTDLEGYCSLMERTKKRSRILRDAPDNDTEALLGDTIAKDVALRERGYKSLVLLGLQSPPNGVVTGGEAWGSFLSRQMADKGVDPEQVALMILRLSEVCAPKCCSVIDVVPEPVQCSTGSPVHRANTGDQREERRFLRLLLPAFFTVCGMHNFQSNCTYEMLSKLVRVTSVVISNLMNQWNLVSGRHGAAPGDESRPELAHDLEQEMKQLLKLAQGVFATMLQSRLWLAVIVKQLYETCSNSRTTHNSLVGGNDYLLETQRRILRNSLDAFMKLQRTTDTEDGTQHLYRGLDMKMVGQEFTTFVSWALTQDSTAGLESEVNVLSSVVDDILSLPPSTQEYSDFVAEFQTSQVAKLHKLVAHRIDDEMEHPTNNSNQDMLEVEYLTLVQDLRMNAFYDASHPQYDSKASSVLRTLHKLHASNREFFDSLLADKVNLSLSFKQQIQNRVQMPVETDRETF